MYKSKEKFVLGQKAFKDEQISCKCSFKLGTHLAILYACLSEFDRLQKSPVTGLSLRFQVAGELKLVGGGTKRQARRGGGYEACPPQKMLECRGPAASEKKNGNPF